MCLILFSWKQKPGFKLVLAANRDEFYDRPTQPARYWEDESDLIAGRDLIAGGTWLGMTRNGRFAAVTNYRDPTRFKKNAPSRGCLTTEYLKSQEPPSEYLDRLKDEAKDYNGFNLLVGNAAELWYYNNVNHNMIRLESGYYGLSNALLNTPWPKVIFGKKLFRNALNKAAVSTDDIFEIMANNSLAPDDQLPATGVPFEWEKAISAIFIKTVSYGTCSSALLTIDDQDKIRFVEKNYPMGNRVAKTTQFEVQLGE